MNFEHILKNDVLLLDNDELVIVSEDYDENFAEYIGQVSVIDNLYSSVGIDNIVVNLGNINIKDNTLNEIKIKYPEYFI